MFLNPWKNYLKIRNIENGENDPNFPEKYDVAERHDFYKTVSGLNNWPGSLGNYFFSTEFAKALIMTFFTK